MRRRFDLEAHIKEQDERRRQEIPSDNLLADTLSELDNHGHSPGDVRWVGSPDIWMTWDEFAGLADTGYDPSWGLEEVATDLLVVGDGWWLERHEYDGLEWWEHKALPAKPERHDVPPRLTRRQAPAYFGWESRLSQQWKDDSEDEDK